MRLLARLALALALLSPVAADARPVGYSYKPGRIIKRPILVNDDLAFQYVDGTVEVVGRVKVSAAKGRQRRRASGPGRQDGQSIAGPPGPPGIDGKSITGPAGIAGKDGKDGAAGAAGVTPTLAIGAITTGAPGSAASVTARQSTPNNYAFDFTIPAGQAGAAGVSAVRCAAKRQTAADGTFSWPIAACSLTAPVVSADVEATGSRDFVATLISVSASTVTGRVRRSRPLPAVIGLIGALVGYDTFEAPGVVTVHLTAQEATP